MEYPTNHVKRRRITSSNSSIVKFNDLPDVILRHVFELLDTKELLNLCKTNGRISKLSKPFLYEKILVYHSEYFVNYYRDGVTKPTGAKFGKNIYAGYTVISVQNYMKLLGIGKSNLEMVATVVFFYVPVTLPLLKGIPSQSIIISEKRGGQELDVPKLRFLRYCLDGYYYVDQVYIKETTEDFYSRLLKI